MKWSGGRRGAEPVALIGKGVCFDSGGISIKPASGMEDAMPLITENSNAALRSKLLLLKMCKQVLLRHEHPWSAPLN